MNVYIVEASDFWYDEYDSLVVVARSEEEALELVEEKGVEYQPYFQESQYPLKAKKVDLDNKAVIHLSFNAG